MEGAAFRKIPKKIAEGSSPLLSTLYTLVCRSDVHAVMNLGMTLIAQALQVVIIKHQLLLFSLSSAKLPGPDMMNKLGWCGPSFLQAQFTYRVVPHHHLPHALPTLRVILLTVGPYIGSHQLSALH